MPKLTEKFCREAEPDAIRREIADGNCLFLTVHPSGGKAWTFRFRFNGVNSKYTLGHYPQMSVAEARKRVAECRALLKVGLDPAEYARKSIVVKYSRSRWVHRGCGAFMIMLPEQCRIELHIAALDAIRCPYCGKGPTGITLAKSPRRILGKIK